jgi:monothiol glutaredoxin
MKADEVTTLIRTQIPDAQVKVEGEGCNFSITVISEQFKGMSLVQRQRSVMAPFKEKIASGELHALSVKALAPEEN